jgi:DNA-binding NarL/FixJ family response regulator
MLTQAASKISVLIVDDHPAFRAGIRAILEKTSDIYVAGEAGNADEAGRLLDEVRPRIILLDLKIPGFSPSEFEKWAREHYPETITLVLTAHDRDAYLASMMEAGTVGYLDKNMRGEQLISSIRRAAYAYTDLLKVHKVSISMAAVGKAEENGYAERLMRTIKEEEVDLSEYLDFQDAMNQIGHFIDDVYMTKRIHSSLGYLTPAEFETDWRLSQLAEVSP